MGRRVVNPLSNDNTRKERRSAVTKTYYHAKPPKHTYIYVCIVTLTREQ